MNYSNKAFKNYLLNSNVWNYSATIRSSFKLSDFKLEKYCSNIISWNPSIKAIIYVLEQDSDPYSTDSMGECYYTNYIYDGNHAHLIINTEGHEIERPIPARFNHKLPYFIPYWEKIKGIKNYIKYNLPKISKSGENWGIVLQDK